MDYRPQEHAAALADWTQLLLHQSREIAVLRGQMDRLLQAMPQDRGAKADAIFESFVLAAFAAMKNTTWTVADLVERAQEEDETALMLAAAITSVGGDVSNKRLGKFLTNRAAAQSLSTDAGLEIKSSGWTRGVRAWVVSRVSDLQTNIQPLL